MKMGLDWNPLGKPRPGFEQEFYALLGQLTKPERWVQPSHILHTTAPADQDSDALLERLFEVQISPYETLGAPRVGRDPEADVWIRSKYEGAPNKPPTIDEWVQQFQGYYAIELVRENDGLPPYSNAPLGGEWERWSFRAKFLDDCEDVLGEALFHEAWGHHTATQLADYGERLMRCVSAYATANDVRHVLRSRWLDKADAARAELELGPLHKAHVIASAARWAAYWSSHGHRALADY
jgi:hypothetical protein